MVSAQHSGLRDMDLSPAWHSGLCSWSLLRLIPSVVSPTFGNRTQLNPIVQLDLIAFWFSFIQLTMPGSKYPSPPR